MKNFFLSVIIIFLPTYIYSNESLLTIQQQLERLQREVSDLSQSVFSNKTQSSGTLNNEMVTNLSAIDMRIYDLEKDVKNLNGNLEEIFFQIEDLLEKINYFDSTIENLNSNLIELNKKYKLEENQNTLVSNNDDEALYNNNSLGSLKITSDKENLNSNEDINEDVNLKTLENLSPEDQFQAAFDNIRNKQWDKAKISFSEFIKLNPDSQLSGSAHYWLGELHILENKYRDAALIFAEGYQKYPTSIKAPDMLFKLSESLFKIDKKIESCATMDKFLQEYPNNKLEKKIIKNIDDYECKISLE